MEWPNQRFKWIALFHLLLLTEQASGFSACQHPPQEIRISRGQKITVVYWVGQNAIEDEGWKAEAASTLGNTEKQETSSTETITYSTQDVTGESESDGTTSGLEISTSTSTDIVEPSSSELSTVKAADTTPNSNNEAISTESRLQMTDAKQNDIPTTDPSIVDLSSTPVIPSSTLNSTILQEDSNITTESDSPEFLLSGRYNSTFDEEKSNLTTPSAGSTSTTPTVSRLSGETSNDDVTTVQSESTNFQSDTTSPESQNDEKEIPTFPSVQFRSEHDGGTEVEYWSTTLAPEGDDADTDETLLDGKGATETVESTTISQNDNSLPSTTQLPREELTGKSNIDATTAESLENSTAAIDENNGSNSDNYSSNIDGNVNISESSTTATEPLGGRSQETTILSDDLLPIEEKSEQSANTTFDSIANETLPVNSSKPDIVPNLEVRASLLAASTLSPLGFPAETSTENATDPTSTDGLSIFETISTTIKNLFSTSNPQKAEFDESTVAFPNSSQSNDSELKQEPEEMTLGTNDEQQEMAEISTTSEIVFDNATVDPEIVTIDPRNAENTETNSTEEHTANSGDQSHSITINITDSSEFPKTELADTVTNVDLKVVTTPADQLVTEEQVDEDEGLEQDGEDGNVEDDGQPNLVSAPEAIDPFQEMPGVLIPIGSQETDETPEDFVPDIDTMAQEGRRIEFPMGQFDPFDTANNGPILIPSSDDIPFEDDEGNTKDVSAAKKHEQPIFLPLPTVDIDRNPLVPPPIFLRFPNRGDNSFSSRHGYVEQSNSPVFVHDLQPEASSSSGPFYRNLYSPDQMMMMPPESPVHYVSVLRPPDGVLPIRSLRMTPAKHTRVLQSRTKRNINDTNCEWIFKSDPGVPLLLTFKSFSTPETTNCEDHYISVERESNGFQSRWCGVSGERPGHASFARSEISLHLFSKGDGSFPTGFSVEVQALDLKLLRKYAEVRRIIKNQ